MWGVSLNLTHLILVYGGLLVLHPCAGSCGECLLHTLSWFMEECLLVLHNLCWFMSGVSLTHPELGYGGSFSYLTMPVYVGIFLHASCWLLSLQSFSKSLTQSMSASLCGELLLYKTGKKKKKSKRNKNIRNWKLLPFKAVGDIMHTIHKVTTWLPAENAEINTNMKWVSVSVKP